jgi:hypothetical protein
VPSPANTAYYGGGIDNGGNLNAQVTAIRDTFTDTFTGNTAPVGGMENEWVATVTISTFLQNKASSDGGGFFNDDTATITGATFNQNKAATDGRRHLSGIRPVQSRPGNPVAARHAQQDRRQLGGGGRRRHRQQGRFADSYPDDRDRQPSRKLRASQLNPWLHRLRQARLGRSPAGPVPGRRKSPAGPVFGGPFGLAG